jgi:uncharacterized protein YecE (DUF72 family)
MAAETGAGGILIGTQGWSYDEWDGWAYPRERKKGTAGSRIPRYAQLGLPLVEIDSTYHYPQPAARLQQWADAVPEGFLFAAKIPKSITQEARLEGADALHDLERFIAGMRVMGAKLGPLLFQMSPGFRFPTGAKALRVALESLAGLGGEGLRFAMEFRHPSWLTSDEIPALLREHGVAWVWNDWEPTQSGIAPLNRAIDEKTQSWRVTCDEWAYIRLVGDHSLDINFREPVIDRSADLARWAEFALRWREGRPDRLIYFLLNNHYAGSSIRSAQMLQPLLGLPALQLLAFSDAQDGTVPQSGQRVALPGLSL